MIIDAIYLNRLEAVAAQAGDLVMAYYNQAVDLAISLKEDQTPVTLADKTSDHFLREALQELEHIPVLSEETQDDGTCFNSGRIWLVDPLDGTKDFIAKTDDFTINIALIEAGRPILGWIYLPVQQVSYYAVYHQGAYKKHRSSVDRIRLKTKDRFADLVLLKSRFSDSQAHQVLVEQNRYRVAEVQVVGSCIKGCLIAEGRAHGYYRYGPTSEWDTAPMDLIIHESGGYLRTLDHKRLQYNRKDHVNHGGFYVVSGPEADLIGVDS